MENIIELNNISKSFNKRTLLKDVNLKVDKGKTIGIIGANGSGKSVLFKIIIGLTTPDVGDVYVNGEKIGEDTDFPQNTGALINEPGYLGAYTGFKNLQYLAQINDYIDDNKIKETLQLVGLDPDDDTKVKTYSSGMKKKLGIAQAIMENQEIIILDEPFNALDVKSYANIKKVLMQLHGQEKTILLTSHNQSDIEELCDEVYIIIENELLKMTEQLAELYF